AANGVNTLDSLSAHSWKVFYPENNGREGLFIVIQSLSVKYFGAHPWSLRVVSGIFGVLTVLGLFFLTKLLFGYRLALLASYLISISFWPVNFSRIGFRAAMLPFILVWTFYFLWKGMQSRSKILLFLSGIVYGIGFNTYISWRVSPLLLGILFLAFLFNKDWNKKYVIKSGLIFLAGTLIIMAPLAYYYIQNPADFMGRAAQVSIFNSTSPIKALGESIVKTLGMFNVYGDGNWRHNFSGRPELFWPIGIGFLVGLIVTFRHLFSQKNFFLIAWFFVMLLPNFLAPEGAPHALRALGAMPAVFIISAIGLGWIYKFIQKKLDSEASKPQNSKYINQIGRIKKELALLAILLLVFTGVWEYKTYFIVWANKMEVYGNFEQRLTDIGNYLNNLPNETNKYVVVNETGTIVKGVSIQAQPIMFLAYDKNINYLNPDDISNIPSNLSNTIIIPTKSDPEILNLLKQKYPLSREVDFITFKAIKIPAPFTK
ncbi:MAG: glycosyltransferase family 39 protein, partial [Patescibacteria group bacterium]